MDDKHYLDYLEKGYTNQGFVKAYEAIWQRKYPEILKINGLPIHFDPNAKKILVALSGGADSSMLTYMLCKLIEREKLETKIYCYTMVRFWKEKPWLEPMSTDVYNWLKNKFPNIIMHQHIGFLPPVFETVPLGNLGIKTMLPPMANCDVLVSVEYQTYLLESKGYEWVYSGTTMNPPLNTTDQPKFRDEKVIKDNWSWVIDGPSVNPFGLLRKNYTMAQYINYDLDELLQLTRSCEGDAQLFGDEYRHNGKYPPECGFCFFCEEKHWGLENSKGFLLENL